MMAMFMFEIIRSNSSQARSVFQGGALRYYIIFIAAVTMMRKPPLRPLEAQRDSYRHSVEADEDRVKAAPLNLALLSNPFLKDQEHYRAIKHELTLYNKRLQLAQITDQYEVRSFDRLFVVMGELASLETRDDQVRQLKEVWSWWLEQRRKIKQRKDQGIVKYKTDRKLEKARLYRSQMAESPKKTELPLLQNEQRYAEVFPYEFGHRTSHREEHLPPKRLTEYKRKMINVTDHNVPESEGIKRGDKVTYPMPVPPPPPEQIEPVAAEGEEGKPAEGENAGQEGAPKEGEGAAQDGLNPENAEGEAKPAEEPPQQDLGGFGEDPADAEEQQPVEDEEDALSKLAPWNKIYTWSNKTREADEAMKQYKKPHMFYMGSEKDTQRRMENRAVKRMQHSLQVNREERQFAQKAHIWATEKSKIDKEIQFRLESMATGHRYSLAQEPPPEVERLSPADEKKYGLTIPVPQVEMTSIDLNPQNKSAVFPSKPIDKDIRKDRLSRLKRQFNHILNLQDPLPSTERSASLCQTSPRQRNLSQILEDHSLEKEKERELEEIQKIKAGLGKYRVNVNIRTLAEALVPKAEDHKQQTFVSPEKSLPNNPFWVEPKKKKKK